MTYSPRITPTPDAWIADTGQPHLGLFQDSIPRFNLDALDLRTEMDGLASGWRRRFGYKQFQFVAVQSPEFVLAIAIADVRYVNSGFAYLYRKGLPTLELSLLHPLAWRCQMSQSPRQGQAQLGTSKYGWQLTPSDAGWQVTLFHPRLQVELQLHRSEQAALALCSPTAYSGFTYTEKNNALAVSGHLVIDGQALNLAQARGGYDFSAGYMRRQTSWRWASINTMLNDGTGLIVPFGLNLAAGVNETGLCENAWWLHGQRQHLSPAQFEFDRRTQGPWRIRTLCDEVDVQFTPDFCRQERLNFGVLASNFRQYVGSFSGHLTKLDGSVVKLDQVQGFTEDHYAKW